MNIHLRAVPSGDDAFIEKLVNEILHSRAAGQAFQVCGPLIIDSVLLLGVPEPRRTTSRREMEMLLSRIREHTSNLEHQNRLIGKATKCLLDEFLKDLGVD